jgi:hypothetical protein
VRVALSVPVRSLNPMGLIGLPHSLEGFVGKSSLVVRSIAVTGAAVAVTMLGTISASAAPAVPKPSASCKVPVFSVSATKAMPGSKITVSGKNFSGCAAQGNSAKPTAVLPVKVGVLTAAKVKDVLATTKTSADGSFSVEVTIPSVSAGGQPKIALAAESIDPVTKLTYAGLATVVYSTPAAPTTAAPTTAQSATTLAPTATSTQDIPTAVPAGSGGLSAPNTPARTGLEIGLVGGGTLLLAAGGITLIRRRSAGQH